MNDEYLDFNTLIQHFKILWKFKRIISLKNFVFVFKLLLNIVYFHCRTTSIYPKVFIPSTRKF